MKVAQLKEILNTLDDEMDIVLQRDPEGNGYAPLCGADPDAVIGEDEGRIETVYSLSWTADDCCLDDDEWEALKAGPKALILWPEY